MQQSDGQGPIVAVTVELGSVLGSKFGFRLDLGLGLDLGLMLDLGLGLGSESQSGLGLGVGYQDIAHVASVRVAEDRVLC